MLSFLMLVIETLILGIAGSSGADTAALSVVFIGMLSVCLVCELYRGRRTSGMWLPLACGYLLRLFFLFWDVYFREVYMLPHSGADTEGFFASAIHIASGVADSYGGMYTKLLGRLFSLTGQLRLYAQFLNVMLSVLALYLVLSVMQRCAVRERVQRRAMWVLCLLPNFAILSSILLRESVIAALVAVSLYFFVRWMKEDREAFFWLGFVSAMGASAFHGATAVVAGGYIAVRLVYDARRGRFHIDVKNLIAAAVVGVVFLFLFLNYADVFFDKIGSWDNIVRRLSSDAVYAGSSYAAYVGKGDTIGNFIKNTIPHMVYYLFSPFPWQWRGISDVIAFAFSSVFYFMCTWSAVRCVVRRNAPNRALVICLSLVCLCTVFVFGWGCSASGTAIRHRDKVIAVFTVLWAASSPVGGLGGPGTGRVAGRKVAG